MAKKQNNKRLYITLLVVFLGIVVFGFVGKQAGWIGKKQAKEVMVATVKKVSITEKVNASGKIQPVEEVKISSEVPGEIRELLIREGDSVSVKQLLLKVRPDNLLAIVDRSMATLNTQKANLARAKAQIAQVEAQLTRASQEYERNKKLFEQKAVSEQEYQASLASYNAAKADLEAAVENVEAARYTVASAEASVNESRQNLALTDIYAPISGIVTKLSVEKGERVVGTQQMAGTELLRIANLDIMEVRVNVNENDIIRVSFGDTAIIDVDSYSFMGEKFKGVVTDIANSAKEGATTSVDAVTEFEVKIRLLNDSFKHLIKPGNSSPFRPGMTASVDIITKQKDNALSVPLASVTTRSAKDVTDKPGGPGASQAPKSTSSDDIKEVVFVVEDGKTKMTEVKTGISDFDNIEIVSGLTEGQKVVQGPFLQVSKLLKDGEEVSEKEVNTPKQPEQ